ncbi:MAG: DUF4394 domain-containing protein [Hyphomicrobiaceae bacterium]|nr:DUF4394 domain-containing protein [Hyphomicrobiaceae bacterium]
MRSNIFAKSLATKSLATKLALTVTVALGGGLAAQTADAATLAGLKDGKSIVWIDTDSKKVTGSVALADNATLVGFDVRPADGKLYGVTPDGAIVIVDAKTGKWEKKSQLSEKLPADAMVSVDFNPVADRMRIITSTGMSLRVNVDDGKATVDGSLKYAETDANKGKMPKVMAAGYSNSFAGTKETALYDIDATNGMLLKQAPPNDGIVTGIGSLGVKVDGPIAFDVWSDGKGMNVGWLLAGGTLHSVDLANGAAKSIGAIAGMSGKVTDIAILPGM